MASFSLHAPSQLGKAEPLWPCKSDEPAIACVHRLQTTSFGGVDPCRRKASRSSKGNKSVLSRWSRKRRLAGRRRARCVGTSF